MKISKQVATALAEKVISLTKESQTIELNKKIDEIMNTDLAKEFIIVSDKIKLLRSELDKFQGIEETLIENIEDKFPDYKFYTRSGILTISYKNKDVDDSSMLANDILIANHVEGIAANKLVEHFVNKATSK